MEYRLQGRTFIDIGKALGVTPGRAHQLVDEALAATLQEPAAHRRALALARLEAVMTGLDSCVDAPGDASRFFDSSEHVIECGHVSGLEGAALTCRGPVWRYADQVPITFASSRLFESNWFSWSRS